MMEPRCRSRRLGGARTRLAGLLLLAVPALAQPAPEEKAPSKNPHAAAPAIAMDPASLVRSLAEGLGKLTLPSSFCGGVAVSDPWIPAGNPYLGSFMKDLVAPRRAPSRDLETWGGARPQDAGAFGNGYPFDLTVLAIEDYQARGGQQPTHRGVRACAEAIAQAWKQEQGASLLLAPRVEVLLDERVTAAEFTGAHPRAFRESDLVLFIGHGSETGPFLGWGQAGPGMAPANYAWSGGRAKWFINASCLGLSDGRGALTPDVDLLVEGNQGRDRDGNSVPPLGGWGKPMGKDSADKDRLHAIFGYKSISWFNPDSRQSGQAPQRPAIFERRLDRRWEDYPAYLFIKALMGSDTTLEAQGLPRGMGISGCSAWISSSG
ncbi:MAG TPA: hypothetical protein VK188_09370 [Holophaga sp.]|nr:hypothetical protein [Holophaga sp.]